MNNNKCYMIVLVGLLTILVLGGCKSSTPVAEQKVPVQEEENPESESVQDKEPEEASKEETEETASPQPLSEDLYGNYRESGGEIACLLDGTLTDESYNEAIGRGIQTYALAAGVSFSYYHPTDKGEDIYEEMIIRAVEDKVKIIVCPGYGFGKAIGKLQEIYPDISFLMVDGEPIDEKGEPMAMADNVCGISFREEEAGYLAGYMAVMEGYRRLGFIGGKKEPSVIRYGFGYLQGIDAAAQDMELSDVEVNYWYSGSYSPDKNTAEKAEEWYAGGTEIIFACGGALYQSVLEAAEGYNGLLIGVDTDQNGLSEHFLTSAFKDVENAVIISLDDYYAMGGCWSEELAGKSRQYGVENNCVGIPTLSTEWKFKNVTLSDYYAVYKKLKRKEVVVSAQTDIQPQVSVRVNGFE